MIADTGAYVVDQGENEFSRLLYLCRVIFGMLIRLESSVLGEYLELLYDKSMKDYEHRPGSNV